ncbi:putative ribonuclease H-like domain-containing protein [Tanacetum coccineum]
MDTLSKVSEYLNNLEELLDDGDSLEARNIKVEKSKKELEMFEALGNKRFVRVGYGDYGRKTMKEVHVEIHGFTFLVDFVVIGYANEGEPLVIFGRDFLATTKSKVDFCVGEIRIDLTMLEEERDVDALLVELVKNMEEVRSSNGKLVKIGKASWNKGHNVKEALDKKYQELEESKPILEVLENYITYRKKLDEVMMGRARLSNNEFGEEDKMRIVEHGLPKKMCDPGNFVLPNLKLSDPRPYHSNLTITDNAQAKAMGEVRNVRIQIGYQAYLVDFLVLDILIDKELSLLLGHPFLRTCGPVIDMRCGTLSIDDGIIRHTYFLKPRAKAYLENFKIDKKDDWLSCFEVGRDEHGNHKYCPVAPSFLDIEDEMERALAMEAHFNPFKNIIVFKKLIEFLGSLPVQLKNADWGNEGYRLYKKIESDGGMACQVLATSSSQPNPLIAKYAKRNKKGTINYNLQPVMNANLKWKDLPSRERHAYHKRLCKFQLKSIGTPRVADWTMFYVYSLGKTLKELMKMEYLHDDKDVFVDYSWERALSVEEDVYPKWCFAVLLGLYEPSELDHWLFATHFIKLEIDDKLFDHDVYWRKIGKPTGIN